MILKSTQENELLLKQEKWQDFLAQKPRNTQGAPVWLSPATELHRRSSVGAQSDKGVPGIAGSTCRETASFVPYPVKAGCCRVLNG